MKIVNFLSAAAMPMIIILIILYGIKEKKKVFDLFLEGAKDGMKIVVELFPTLLGIFLAIGLLRNSGILDCIIQIISPITNLLKIPNQILPLAMLRPISGSASMGVAVDIMQKYGVDSMIGKITSTIMGSTETTFYTIAIYTSCIKVKKIRFVLAAALLADLAGMITSVIICKIMS
ncbi:MAG: spore maturation protein [Clostridia bacterium]|jgi:spore maturation protein B|nr:spore maturation protein [Clostridia bacterium]